MMTTAPYRKISLPIHKRLSLDENPVDITASPDGSYYIHFSARPDVIRLDADLQEVWRKDLQAQTIHYVSCQVTVSSHHNLIALSGETAIRLVNETGQLLWQHAHAPWYHFLGANCFFAQNDQLMLFISPEEPDLLQVMRTNDFEVTGRYELAGSQEYRYTFHPTPDKDKILLEAAAGQEELQLYMLHLQGDKIQLESLPALSDGIPGNFSPDGKTLVTAPHYDEGLQLFSFPEMKKTAEVSQEALFSANDAYRTPEDTDSLYYTVLFINDATLLAFTRFGRLLLIDRATLVCFGECMLEGCEIRAYDLAGRPTTDPTAIVDYGGDIVTVQVTPAGQLLITHSDGELRLYVLPDIRLNP